MPNIRLIQDTMLEINDRPDSLYSEQWATRSDHGRIFRDEKGDDVIGEEIRDDSDRT